MLARLCVTPLLATGIVSDRCMLFPICVDSSKVALRWPLNRIGLSLYMLLLRAVDVAISGCASGCCVGVASSSFKAPSGSFWVTGVRGEILAIRRKHAEFQDNRQKIDRVSGAYLVGLCTRCLA